MILTYEDTHGRTRVNIPEDGLVELDPAGRPALLILTGDRMIVHARSESPEVYCANDCDWVGMDEDLTSDDDGNEPHCPKCGSNSFILDIPVEIQRAFARYLKR